MARRYTKSRKDEILTYLDENAGDVALTSLQMAVPERTLREWKRLRNLTVAAAETNRRRQIQPSDSPLSAAVSAASYESLNNLLMHNAFKIAESLTHGLDDSPVHQRMMALAHLIDRMLKLNASLPSLDQDNAIRIEFIAPDGVVYDNLDHLEWDDDDDPPT